MMLYQEVNKNRCQLLKFEMKKQIIAQIESADRQIDELVYDLYGYKIDRFILNLTISIRNIKNDSLLWAILSFNSGS